MTTTIRPCIEVRDAQDTNFDVELDIPVKRLRFGYPFISWFETGENITMNGIKECKNIDDVILNIRKALTLAYEMDLLIGYHNVDDYFIEKIEVFDDLAIVQLGS